MTDHRLVSGIKPTGRMHIGNMLGAVQTWVKVQASYDSFFFVADYHALTSHSGHADEVKKWRLGLAKDILSMGVNPDKATFFFQSDVPAHAELYIVLSMLSPLPWLQRVPTYKDKATDSAMNTHGFLGYPVLQAADILLYRADVVPVGDDQLPHLELVRELARRFNHRYQSDLLHDCQPLLSKQSVLMGIDGRKMSKSYGNTIAISDDEKTVESRLMAAVTDPQRLRLRDPGRPEKCTVYTYHQLWQTPERASEIAADCRQATIGCVDCKRECAAALNGVLDPIRQQREQLSDTDVEAIMAAGASKANAVTEPMMAAIKACIGLH